MDHEQTIRNLEALALRPGTKEEGSAARAKAIFLSKKHGIATIFSREVRRDPIPVVVAQPIKQPPKPPKPPETPAKLHPKVLAMEESLTRNGWTYRYFLNGNRVYKWDSRPNEEIQMQAYWFGEFSCQHLFKPSGQVRPAGNTPVELEHFFDSISYRHELWPRQRPRTVVDFMEPLEPESEPIAETISEETTELMNPEDRIDIIEDMLLAQRNQASHSDADLISAYAKYL